MKNTPNPLLNTGDQGQDDQERETLAVDQANITAPTVMRRAESPKTIYKRLMRGESARKAVRDMRPDEEIFGFTKGQFSLIDLIAAILEQTGPAKLAVSTWAVNIRDIEQAASFFRSGQVTEARFLLDISFQRTRPQFIAAIRETFGDNALRMSQVHAKFVTIRNDKWDITVRTSMNLNQNPRFEDFTITNNAQLADFIDRIIDDIFQTKWVDTVIGASQTFMKF